LRLVDSEPTMSQVQEFLDFCDLVHAQDLDENWSMTWLDALREGRTLIARLGVHTGLDDVPNQIWEVGARDTRAFSLMEFDLNEWTFSQDHVLLWEHQEPFSQLNYRGPLCRHAEVLWNLHERHCAAVGHWIPFARYINGALLSNRLSGGGGVLADGPEPLLREYADVLASSDLELYFPYPSRPAHCWDDEHQRWIDVDRNLSVLVLGGSSYIVGVDFFANRLD
jgi:hypothetical protein